MKADKLLASNLCMVWHVVVSNGCASSRFFATWKRQTFKHEVFDFSWRLHHPVPIGSDRLRSAQIGSKSAENRLRSGQIGSSWKLSGNRVGNRVGNRFGHLSVYKDIPRAAHGRVVNRKVRAQLQLLNCVIECVSTKVSWFPTRFPTRFPLWSVRDSRFESQYFLMRHSKYYGAKKGIGWEVKLKRTLIVRVVGELCCLSLSLSLSSVSYTHLTLPTKRIV